MQEINKNKDKLIKIQNFQKENTENVLKEKFDLVNFLNFKISKNTYSFFVQLGWYFKKYIMFMCLYNVLAWFNSWISNIACEKMLINN